MRKRDREREKERKRENARERERERVHEKMYAKERESVWGGATRGCFRAMICSINVGPVCV